MLQSAGAPHADRGRSHIRIAAGSKIVVTAFLLPQDIRGLTLTAVTTEGKTYSYTTQATLRAGHRYSFTIGDMQKQAQQIAEDYSDWMKYLPDNVHLSQVSMPDRTTHARCTARIMNTRAACPAKGIISNGCKTSYSAT